MSPTRAPDGAKKKGDPPGIHRDRLEKSNLSDQKELFKTDVNLEGISKLGKKFNIVDAVQSATVERTIEGSSTVTFEILDRDRILLRGGTLGAKQDIEIDGLWWRLMRVEKSGDSLTLTFEDREIAVLRTYDKFINGGAWGATTRAKFARRMIQEVKEIPITFFCPELEQKSPNRKNRGGTTNQSPKNQDTPQDEYRHYERDNGIVRGSVLKVKGQSADKEQIKHAEIILDVGKAMKARRKVLVCAIMTAIQESSIRPLPDTVSDRDSQGVFQQRPSQGWPDTMDTRIQAREFFERAIKNDKDDPNMPYYALCQSVQRSAYPTLYNQWRVEGERMVQAYGIPGRDDETLEDIFGVNLQNALTQQETTDYQFSRGKMTKDQAGNKTIKKETSWECLQRLAEEVAWRCFMISGTCYFISEPELFKSKPRAVLDEQTPGINWIDFDYDVGKHNANVTVSCRIDRWEAPPGTIVMLQNMGVMDGRWLVASIERDLFTIDGTITLKKPRPVLPEPEQDSGSTPFESDIGWDDLFDLSDKEIKRWVTVNPPRGNTSKPTKPHVIKWVAELGKQVNYRLTIWDNTTHSKMTVNGNISDHYEGNAADIPSSGANLTRLGQAALIKAGADPAWARKQTGGLFNVGGVQIIFNTMSGGNHYDHLHVGLPNVPHNPGDRPGASESPGGRESPGVSR